MACTEFQPALSELVDGTLSREGKARLESHLEECTDCRALLADLQRLRESARALPKMTPPESLCQKVRADFDAEASRASAKPAVRASARLAVGASARPAVGASARPAVGASAKQTVGASAKLAVGASAKRVSAGMPASSAKWRPGSVLRFIPRRTSVLAGLAAAAVLVLAVSAGIFFATRPAVPASAVEPTSAHQTPEQTVQSVESELDLADQHYEKAIAGLDQVAKDGQALLDPQVAEVLQKNIGVIDQAIRESRTALRSQPTSELAQASLFDALQRKVGLLRDTISLINEMRKGDQAGTAKVVGSLGKI